MSSCLASSDSTSSDSTLLCARWCVLPELSRSRRLRIPDHATRAHSNSTWQRKEDFRHVPLGDAVTFNESGRGLRRIRLWRPCAVRRERARPSPRRHTACSARRDARSAATGCRPRSAGRRTTRIPGRGQARSTGASPWSRGGCHSRPFRTRRKRMRSVSNSQVLWQDSRTRGSMSDHLYPCRSDDPCTGVLRSCDDHGECGELTTWCDGRPRPSIVSRTRPSCHASGAGRALAARLQSLKAMRSTRRARRLRHHGQGRS